MAKVMLRKLFLISVLLLAQSQHTQALHKNQPMLWANHVLKLIGEECSYREPVYLPSSESGKTGRIKVSSKAQKELVKVYPNPASDVVNIVVPRADNLSIQLYTIDGKLMVNQEGKLGSVVLNVKDFNPGVYLLKTTFGNGITETKRVSIVK